MAKRPRINAADAKPETKSNGFLEAIKFVNLVTKEHGTPNEVHSLICNRTIVAHNGTIGAGCLIEEDIYAAPNNYLLLQALSKCGQDLSMLQLEGFRLAIKSNKFKAVVPCIDPNIFADSVAHKPDEAMYDITDTFKEGLEIVGTLASETGQNVITASIFMNENSLISSNEKVIFEYWHGLPLPFGCAIPKAIVNPLVKAAKKLTKFGCSNASVTFWFEDQSWLKTQIYADQWPDVSKVLTKKSNAWPLPGDFWTALAAVAPFSPSGAVYFGSGTLSSHPETGVGASYECAGLPKGPIFSARLLELIKPYAKEVDFLADNGRMLVFFGDRIRGVVAGMGTGQ